MHNVRQQYPPPAFKWLLGATVIYGLLGLTMAGFHFVLTDSGPKVYPKASAGFHSTFVDARGMNVAQLARAHPQVAQTVTAHGDQVLFQGRRTAPVRSGSGSASRSSAATYRSGPASASTPAPTPGWQGTADRPSGGVGTTGQPVAQPSDDVMRALMSQGVVLPGGDLTGQALAIALSVDPHNPVSVARAAAELKLLTVTESGRQGLQLLEELERNPEAVERSRRIIEQGARDMGDLLRRMGGGGG